MDEDDALQALAYAMELQHQYEVEMLASDAGYGEWLTKLELEKETENDERKRPELR